MFPRGTLSSILQRSSIITELLCFMDLAGEYPNGGFAKLVCSHQSSQKSRGRLLVPKMTMMCEIATAKWLAASCFTRRHRKIGGRNGARNPTVSLQSGYSATICCFFNLPTICGLRGSRC
jgi:hypothetical protein